MSYVEFYAAGLPQTQGSLRAILPKGRAHPVVIHDSSKALHAWRAAIVYEATRERTLKLGGAMLDGALWIALRFSLQRPASGGSLSTGRQRRLWLYPWRRPDVDKLARAVLDSLTGVLFADDGQIVRLTAEKVYGTPGVHVVIAQIGDDLPPIDSPSRIREVVGA